jgi:uncharacterized membrane protein YozB (DUF420 family)
MVMVDSLELGLAMLNVVLSGVGFLLIIAGIRWFETGLFVRALKRAIPAGLLLFLLFFTKAMVAMGALPSDSLIEDILGTLFMLGLLFVTYGLVNDWKQLKSELRSQQRA